MGRGTWKSEGERQKGRQRVLATTTTSTSCRARRAQKGEGESFSVLGGVKSARGTGGQPTSSTENVSWNKNSEDPDFSDTFISGAETIVIPMLARRFLRAAGTDATALPSKGVTFFGATMFAGSHRNEAIHQPT